MLKCGQRFFFIHLIFVFIAGLLIICSVADQSLEVNCREDQKIKTQNQAIEYVKKHVFDISDYAKRPIWQPVFASEVYREARPVGHIGPEGGWIVGVMKDDFDYYFGVDFRFKDKSRSAAIFAEINICGLIRNQGFSID
jgi:hypothetical protein